MAGSATQTSREQRSKPAAGVARAKSNAAALEALIRERAYHLWEAEGRPADRHDAHWLQAEREVRKARPASLNGKPARGNGAGRAPGSKATKSAPAGAAGGRGARTKPGPAKTT